MGYSTRTDYEKEGPDDLCEDLTGDGTVDLRGQPSVKSKTGGWKATYFIHALIASDNFTSPGFAAVLQPYLFGTLHMSIAESSNAVANSIGVAYILAIFWGYVADSYIGKFYTIIIGATICTSGWVILLISSWLPSLQPASCIPTIENPTCPRASHIDWFIAGLFIMSVGSAGLKPNMTAMAKDQFDSTDPLEKKSGGPFFTTYYWNLSAVVVIICTIIVFVQSNVSYRVGFSIQAGLYLLGVLIYFSGTLLFRHTKPTGSSFTRLVRVPLVAVKNARKQVPSNASELFEVDEFYANHFRIPKIQHTKRWSFLDKAAVKSESWDVDQRRLPGPLDVCTVTQVEELKTVLQILPIWVATIVAFTLYSQIGGVTQQESSSLDRKWGPHFTFPSASAIVFLMITTIVFIPIYECVVIPTLRKFTGHPRGLSLLKLMGIGLFLIMCAMVVAALVEQKRVNVIRNKNITVDQTLNGGVPMTVWWLLPQYVLLGVSDIFLGVNMLIFFYTETPEHMKSIATSMYFASVSIGYFIASGVINTVNKYTKQSGGWIAGQFNTGGLRNYYYLLAAIMAVNLIFFIIFAHFYTYKKFLSAEQQSIETNQVVPTQAGNSSEVKTEALAMF